jgi:hypothetical protein
MRGDYDVDFRTAPLPDVANSSYSLYLAKLPGQRLFSDLAGLSGYRAMMNSLMHNLARILRGWSRESSSGIRKISSAHITTVLVAAALFATIYALETKANPASESSQDLFEVLR